MAWRSRRDCGTAWLHDRQRVHHRARRPRDLEREGDEQELVHAVGGELLEVEAADAVMVGSYVPDGVEVGRWVQRTAQGTTCFYDIDTPVTLAKLGRGDFEYLSPELIPGYDIYFSFTGGPTLDLLEREFGSPAARALYCSVDTDRYRPADVPNRWDLSYLGTYSDDRQPTLEKLLLEPARAEMKARALRPNRDQARVVAARFGNDAGMLGAGVLALDELGVLDIEEV